MNKSDLLAKIANCQKMVEQMIINGNLSKKQEKGLNKILNTILRDKNYANQLVEGAPDLKLLEQRYVELEKTLEGMEHEIEVINNSSKQKVMYTIPEEKQNPNTKKARSNILNNTLKVLLAILLTTAIAITGSHLFQTLFGNKDKAPEKDPVEQSQMVDPDQSQDVPEEETRITIDQININDYNDLVALATEIEADLTDGEIGKDDIMYAIKLANFDQLEDKAVFREIDEVMASTHTLGQISKDVDISEVIQKDENTDIYLAEEELLDVLLCSTNLELTLEDFTDAKTDKGYDVYKVAQKCINVINSNNEKAFNYCMAFNDLTARIHLDFSLIPDCPISTRYALAGMYTANNMRILELTAGQNLGPTYGDGYRIDGTHGYICVEELEAFMRIVREKGEAWGNENNALYTFVAQENILNYTQDESLSR